MFENSSSCSLIPPSPSWWHILVNPVLSVIELRHKSSCKRPQSVCVQNKYLKPNSKKLYCQIWQWEETCKNGTACFHCTRSFQWHPGCGAFLFSSYCNSDSQSFCHIILWLFLSSPHLRNGRSEKWPVCRLIQSPSTHNMFTVLISQSSFLFTQWLEALMKVRWDVSKVRV